jgi:hypothetical protein
MTMAERFETTIQLEGRRRPFFEVPLDVRACSAGPARRCAKPSY